MSAGHVEASAVYKYNNIYTCVLGFVQLYALNQVEVKEKESHALSSLLCLQIVVSPTFF